MPTNVPVHCHHITSVNPPLIYIYIYIYKHNNPKKNSEPGKHIKRNEGHVFTWKVVCKTPKHKLKGRILEAFSIKLKDPSLNNQLDSFQLKLFQNGIT